MILVIFSNLENNEIIQSLFYTYNILNKLEIKNYLITVPKKGFFILLKKKT